MSAHPQTAVPAEVIDLCICPVCSSALEWEDSGARCSRSGHEYPIIDQIPVLAPGIRGAGGVASKHARSQAEFFDSAETEFEVTRPHGAPAFHGWLLLEKLRRSIDGIPAVSGATALTICGGSGLEAEFIARAGAHVICSDISLGAALRARERARRYGLSISPIVADALRLPFPDRSIDLVYVHDGLHHLEDPLAGLREMARVSARAVSVNEPARAAATALAVRLGLAFDDEDAGNRVHRIIPGEMSQELRVSGFEVVVSARYAMYYKHVPGAVMRLLSRPRLSSIAERLVRGFNAVLGRWGNKSTVQALRGA